MLLLSSINLQFAVCVNRLKLMLKIILTLIGNALTITREGFFIKTVLRFVYPKGLATVFAKTS
jgi:hypothetical protein